MNSIRIFILALLLATPLHAQTNATPPEPAAAVVTDEAAPPEEAKSAGAAFVAKVAEGGWTMGILLAFSVAMGGIIVERLVNLRQRNIYQEELVPDVEKLWAAGEFTKLEKLCAENPSVFTSVVQVMSENRHEPKDIVFQEASEHGAQLLQGHLHKIQGLSVIGALSPLLGLFGTVLGMIESFDTVALMGNLGDASMLAGGISKALITTAGGLVVAIPALGFYYFFKGRITKFGTKLEMELTRLNRRWFRTTAPVETEAAV